MFVIDAGACIDCGACVTECPVQAIHPHDDLPDGAAPFAAVNAAYSAGVSAVRIQLKQLGIPLDGGVDPAYFSPSELAG
jgi:ferredoxin